MWLKVRNPLWRNVYRYLCCVCVRVFTHFRILWCADLWQRNRAPCGDSVLPEVPKTITPMPVLPPLSAPAPVSASPLPQSLPDAPDRESGEPSSSNSPPPVLDVLVDMGFPAAHIRIALDR